MRQIDADALFAEFENVDWYNNADRDEIAEPLILQAPTIDAVSVVRCRECKWYGGDGWESDESRRRHWCNRVSEWGKCIHVNADDYCSYGERREP